MEEKVLQGVLLKAHGGFYFVQAASQLYTCSLRGRLKQELKQEPQGNTAYSLAVLGLVNVCLFGLFCLFVCLFLR